MTSPLSTLKRSLLLAILTVVWHCCAVQTHDAFPVRLGTGCKYGDYNSLRQISDGTNSERGKPYYSYTLRSRLGEGSYVLHFVLFRLPSEDELVVYNDSEEVYALKGSDTSESFYSAPVVGKDFTLKLFKHSSTSTEQLEDKCFGFEVDSFIFLSTENVEQMEALNFTSGIVSHGSQSPADKGNDESLCGEDESKPAVCFETEENADKYRAARGVARLTISRTQTMRVAYCTGFLLGCEGHLLTNQHCIENWLDAFNTEVEFFAESPVCDAEASNSSESCTERGSCAGSIVFPSTTLVAVSEELDYALVKLPYLQTFRGITSLYEIGTYLQLRESGPVVKEEVYIPQHPLGGGKRISMASDASPGVIESLTADACGGSDAGYYLDTQDGSSGSPVIGVSDNTVVALHHCGGCLNGGILSNKIIEDLKSKNVLPRCAVAQQP